MDGKDICCEIRGAKKGFGTAVKKGKQAEVDEGRAVTCGSREYRPVFFFLT